MGDSNFWLWAPPVFGAQLELGPLPFPMARPHHCLKRLLSSNKGQGSSEGVSLAYFKNQMPHCSSGKSTGLEAEDSRDPVFPVQEVQAENPNQNKSLIFFFPTKHLGVMGRMKITYSIPDCHWFPI